ncbi:CHASE4 domain-containing protein [Methanolobus sp. ZRKC3]|uniref:CHASE4 domain-containing protein n=1 Tax=Methanolobus sp. ZRKC3 TaxID=3125786 RepID=UPI003244697B
MASLRNKTLTIIGVTLIGLIIALYLSSQLVIMNSYDYLEEEELKKDVFSARDLINNDLVDLEKKTADWSVWDETYQFVSENDTSYVENYLMDGTFINQRINFAFFYDTSGDLIYAKGMDLVNEKEIHTFEYIIEHLENESYLFEHEDVYSRKTGYLALEDNIMMITSQPITFSNMTGEPGRVVIMGRHLNSAEMAVMSERTRTTLGMEHIEPVLEETVSEKMISIDPVNESIIIGSLILEDIYGNPSIELSVEMTRIIHRQGKTTTAYLLFTLLVVAAVFGGVVLSLLENMIISKLNSLNARLDYIGRNKAFSSRLDEEDDDEIAHISTSANRMLESLEKSHEAIAKRDKTIKAIIQAIPDMMFQVKRDGTICSYKLSMEECLYESPNVPLGININDVLPENIAAEELKIIEKALETNKMQTMHYQLPIKDEMRDFEARIVASGEDEVMSVVTDVTEIKQTENLRKKDLLLKEIHHRVKNNLQVISSLLKLQSRKFNDPQVIEAFRKSQHRARSMAIAHERLYQSHNLDDINLRKYIKSLVEYLVSSYEDLRKDVKININVEDITLGIDTSIPLGLIINEIVSNSLKHAFKEGSGEIKIEMKPDGEEGYELVISDNGIGFPDHLDFKNTDSLGLQLVNSLVEQIEGDLELKNENGTEFKITFKELSYKRRDYS